MHRGVPLALALFTTSLVPASAARATAPPSSAPLPLERFFDNVAVSHDARPATPVPAVAPAPRRLPGRPSELTHG
ncbi:hypothetical protein ACFXGE_29325, partial [Streptomyces sp. NPDC059378]